MADQLLAVEMIGIFIAAFIILIPIIYWVLPHHPPVSLH